MKELADERKWMHRLTIERLGIRGDKDNVFQNETEALALEARIRSLPVDPRYQRLLVDDDGFPYFTYGYTPYGGSTPFGAP